MKNIYIFCIVYPTQKCRYGWDLRNLYQLSQLWRILMFEVLTSLLFWIFLVRLNFALMQSSQKSNIICNLNNSDRRRSKFTHYQFSSSFLSILFNSICRYIFTKITITSSTCIFFVCFFPQTFSVSLKSPL